MRRGRIGLYSEVEEPASWVLAIAVLAFALGGLKSLSPSFLLSPLFIGILTGFTAHELAHRGVARAYGMSASFVAFVPGLVITFLSGFLPVKFLAPGYVKTLAFYRYNVKGILYSVAAGPLTNIVIASIAIALGHIYPGWSIFLGGIAWVNGWLAFFNLLPIPPLDGSKIFALNKPLWAALIIAAFALTFLLT
ncbi:MAG: metalloprotease [Thermoprotei archaeon]|nr:metalloprotease [Thermoprotei archaeon]